LTACFRRVESRGNLGHGRTLPLLGRFA
jgi:hypothetical protein